MENTGKLSDAEILARTFSQSSTFTPTLQDRVDIMVYPPIPGMMVQFQKVKRLVTVKPALVEFYDKEGNLVVFGGIPYSVNHYAEGFDADHAKSLIMPR